MQLYHSLFGESVGSFQKALQTPPLLPILLVCSSLTTAHLEKDAAVFDQNQKSNSAVDGNNPDSAIPILEVVFHTGNVEDKEAVADREDGKLVIDCHPAISLRVVRVKG